MEESGGSPPIGRQPHPRDQLERGDGVKLAAKGLLPRLVPEQRPPGIGAGGAADHGEVEQGALRHPPRPRLRARLVDTEGGKGAEIDRDERGGDVGRGGEGEERMHGGSITGQWVAEGLRSRPKAGSA